MKHKKSKYLWSLMIVLMMAMAMMIGMTVTASADDSHQQHDGITFKAWTDELAKQQNGNDATAANSLPKEAGAYSLTKDVTLSGNWSVAGTTTLCLNGKTISFNGKQNSIVINDDRTLNLYDCSSDFKGTIKESATSCVHIKSRGTFNMSGGTISGNGGGVENKGTFIMSDGVISGNIASGCGGGVDNVGTFNMSGGTISGNEATGSNSYGGGVYNSYGAFTMSGGTISDNKAVRGGGVNNDSNGTLNISGGMIIDNKATSAAGGVYNSGTFNLSGNPKITGNSKSAEPTNVFISNNSWITIVGELESDASVGVNLDSPSTPFTKGWETYMSGKIPTDYFTSDVSAYTVKQEGDELKLVHNHNFTYEAGTGENANTISAICSADGCDLPVVNGYHTATLTISAPQHTTCGDNENADAQIADPDGIQGNAKVMYQKKTGESSYDTPTDNAPTDAGTYKASITLGQATASIEYTIKYALWVGDVQVASENAANITGSDPVQASYDAASNTLTLNNYKYEGHGCDNDDVKAAIKARMNEDFTINLTGDNTVKHVYKVAHAGAGIYADNNMTITGDGTLTVSDGDNANNYDSRGIRVGKNFTIGSGVTVNATGSEGQYSYGVNVKKLTVLGELNATGGSANNSYGVYTSDDITVSKDGILNAAGGTATNGSFGAFIKNTDGKISIKGAMTAKGNKLAIAKAAQPNPSIDTAAIQYTIPEGYKAVESVNYDGSSATPVAAGGKTSENAKYVLVSRVAPVDSVSLNKTSTDLTAGESETLIATWAPKDILLPDLKWESSDSSIAKVSGSGEVTAVAAGEAIITVRETKGTDDTSDDVTATCTVTVTEKPDVDPPTPAQPSATSIDNAPVVLDLAPLTFTGQPVTPVIQTIDGKTLVPDKDYTVTYTQGDALIEAPIDAGTYTMTITGKGDFAGTTSTEFTIGKAAGTLTAQGNKVKAKSKIVKLKKARKISPDKAYTIEGAIGELTYSKVKANKASKKFKVNAKSGQIKVKKGLKKGKYKLTVLISDAGDNNHEAAEAQAIVKIRIRK